MSKRNKDDEPTAPTAPKRQRHQDDSISTEYVHTPLSEPEKQIRLLRFQPGDKDDPIRLQISTFKIGSTPEYVAISYTWGEQEHEQIHINGKPFVVRQNCRYALWQVRLHRPDVFVWIDSICIAQHERSEKGHQVRIMGSIYEAASHVFACVGESSAETDILPLTVTHLHETGYLPYIWNNPRSIDSYLGPGTMWLSELGRALKMFLRRPYFSRLWIVQEVAAARESLSFLCGSSAICKSDLQPLVSHTLSVRMESCVRRYLDITIVRPRSFSLETVTRKFLDMHCIDPRDVIYGILGLVDWSRFDVPLSPDYNLTPLELLRSLCSFFAPSTLAQVFDHFERRSSLAKDLSMTIPLGEQNPACSFALKTDCAFLQSDEGGRLFSRLFDYYDDGYDQISPLLESKRLGDLQTVYASCSLHTGPVALVCTEASPGDLLAVVDCGIRPLLTILVLRRNIADTFDVVGQCLSYKFFLSSESYLHSFQGSPISISAEAFRARVALKLSAHEYLQLIGQCREEMLNEDLLGLLPRLRTNLLLNAKASIMVDPLLARHRPK